MGEVQGSNVWMDPTFMGMNTHQNFITSYITICRPAILAILV